MHGRVFSHAVAAFRIKITAACFQNSFSNFMQDEHGNIIETRLCAMAMGCGHITQ
jgi:hypothetical protein